MPEFKKNYLSPESQEWVKELQNRIVTLENSLTRTNANLRSTEAQLSSSYNRLDSAVTTLQVNQEEIQFAIQEAQLAMLEAEDNAYNILLVADDAFLAAQEAQEAATTANNAINRLESYTSTYIGINATASFNQNSGTILTRTENISLSTSGGGSREISAIAICSVNAGVNSTQTEDDTVHRIAIEGRISVDGSIGSSETYVGVRKGFTDAELGISDSQVAVYGGGALIPSASKTYSTNDTVPITVSIIVDTTDINSGFYFGDVRIEGILVNISG